MNDLQARFVFKLARNHTWGSPLPREKLIGVATQGEDHDTAEEVYENDVLPLPFVVEDVDGVRIPNSRDAHGEAAEWLQDHTDLEEYVIAASLSRLPEEWPE